jgi:16S rRNA (guanine966-N2)-methyltransferase
MRVISGKYKGRNLKGPREKELRPTGDRLKETLFDILGSNVSGAVVLDVFGGSGAIGIEALSRGAREVVYIESSKSAQRLIMDNLRLCGIDRGYSLLQQDVFTELRSMARQGFRAGIAFFDPPYDWKPYRDLLEIVFERQILVPDGRAVVEHHQKASLPESGEHYRRVRIVRQGDHCLSFYEHSGVRS